MSENTDCYESAEQKFKLTKRCLEVFLKCKHPVGITTKNTIVAWGLDILKQLVTLNLVVVNFSVTTMEEKTRRVLEPRKTNIEQRLKTIDLLSKTAFQYALY